MKGGDRKIAALLFSRVLNVDHGTLEVYMTHASWHRLVIA